MSSHSLDLTPLEADARGHLDPVIADFIAGGSWQESTITANRDAWHRVRLRPRVLRDVSKVDTSVSLLGTVYGSPVGFAPTAFHRLVHPEGELATARAAATAGAPFVLSTRSSQPIEKVAAVAGPWWFQLYVMRDRGITRELAQRAAGAGARALVLTVDVPYLPPRRLNWDELPSGPEMITANLGSASYDHERMQEAPDITFDDIARLRDEAGLPVVVKGVLRADDARACTEAGAAAVWVSNHGGRQLDGSVATAEALSEVAAAVDVPVYVDGGVRTAVDVLRALALGADAVFLGRPALWCLATGGEQGLTDMLNGLKTDLSLALALAGATSPSALPPGLATPPGRP